MEPTSTPPSPLPSPDGEIRKADPSPTSLAFCRRLLHVAISGRTPPPDETLPPSVEAEAVHLARLHDAAVAEGVLVTLSGLAFAPISKPKEGR